MECANIAMLGSATVAGECESRAKTYRISLFEMREMRDLWLHKRAKTGVNDHVYHTREIQTWPNRKATFSTW